ncbi:MAG: hypothetical protein Q7S87_17955 [Agitococcus sp.]|nr:hypothetical protein [Agitococcus sp.]MDO9179213.1 hypothetical protein [Agitococcus sp.]
MNKIQAAEVLAQYPPRTKVADIYHEDPQVGEALSTLMPNFEYPDVSYKTVKQLQYYIAQTQSHQQGSTR